VKRALAHLALIAIAAWLVAQMFRVTVAPQPLNLALWLALGAVAVDLLLLPLYSGADALIRRLPAPLINHVRFPVAISAVLLLVWFPLILQRRPSGYVNALGREPPDYLGRWLAVTAGLFVLSALVLAVRRLTASRAGAPRTSGR
jgi:hypothetical protein